MDDGLAASFGQRGRIYATTYRRPTLMRIVALWQNDQVGREIIKGWKTGSLTSPYDQGRYRVDIALSIWTRTYQS